MYIYSLYLAIYQVLSKNIPKLTRTYISHKDVAQSIEIDREICKAKISYLRGIGAGEAIAGGDRGHASPLAEDWYLCVVDHS